MEDIDPYLKFNLEVFRPVSVLTTKRTSDDKAFQTILKSCFSTGCMIAAAEVLAQMPGWFSKVPPAGGRFSIARVFRGFGVGALFVCPTSYFRDKLFWKGMDFGDYLHKNSHKVVDRKVIEESRGVVSTVAPAIWLLLVHSIWSASTYQFASSLMATGRLGYSLKLMFKLLPRSVLAACVPISVFLAIINFTYYLFFYEKNRVKYMYSLIGVLGLGWYFWLSKGLYKNINALAI